MSLATLIAAHGYWILALGCLLEGETVLVLAALAAHRGYLDPVTVVTIAATFAFAGNQFFFWLGRRHGTALLERWPVLATHSAKIRRLIDRHASLAAVAVRFAYGTRIAGPMLLGASSMSSLRFVVLNALSAIAWALLVGAAGWFFGEAAEAIFGHLAHVEGWLFGALLAALVAWRLLRRRSAQAEVNRRCSNTPRSL
ncbi:MAG TPA: DedA family protein [Steroidobacteraceae bacterium]|nr:DedA family protein [Steroidobacteraceae bacterium]